MAPNITSSHLEQIVAPAAPQSTESSKQTPLSSSALIIQRLQSLKKQDPNIQPQVTRLLQDYRDLDQFDDLPIDKDIKAMDTLITKLKDDAYKTDEYDARTRKVKLSEELEQAQATLKMKWNTELPTERKEVDDQSRAILNTMERTSELYQSVNNQTSKTPETDLATLTALRESIDRKLTEFEKIKRTHLEKMVAFHNELRDLKEKIYKQAPPAEPTESPRLRSR